MRDRGLFGPASAALGWLFVGFLGIPLVALLWFGGRESIWTALASPDSLTAITISLKTSLACMLVVLVFGLSTGLVVARSRGVLRATLETLTSLPMVLPPAAAGIALLLAFGRNGLLGPVLLKLGISLPFTPAAVVLAQCFVASPFMVRSAAEGFGAVDPQALENARLDGASAGAVFWRVQAPMAAPFLAAGFFLAWARALGEFGATILFAGNLAGVTQTMPLAIYLGFETDLKAATGLAVVLLMIAALVLILGRFLVPRRAGD